MDSTEHPPLRYAFKLTGADRKEYFDALWSELRNGGLEAMLFDLRRRDLKGFHPRQIPNVIMVVAPGRHG